MSLLKINQSIFKLFTTQLSTSKRKLISDIASCHDDEKLKSKICENFDTLAKKQNPLAWFTNEIPHSLQFALLYKLRNSRQQVAAKPIEVERQLRTLLKELCSSLSDPIKATLGDREIAKLNKIAEDPNLDHLYFSHAINSCKNEKLTDSYFTNYDNLNLNLGKPLPFSSFPLSFQQGQIGDCYLLTTLYTMSRYDWGKKILNNLFTVNKNGNVNCTFNLKHNPDLFDIIENGFNNKQDEIIKDGYNFHFDKVNHKLTISLTENKALEIKENKKNCQTKEVQIKYLESIVAKVILAQKEKQNNNKKFKNIPTIIFHNGSDRQEHDIFSLLGLKATQCEKKDFLKLYTDLQQNALNGLINNNDQVKQAVKLPQKNETSLFPIYMGKKEPSGGRHAYSLTGLQETDGKIYFRAVNPHNTNKRNFFTREEVLNSDYKFIIFSPAIAE